MGWWGLLNLFPPSKADEQRSRKKLLERELAEKKLAIKAQNHEKFNFLLSVESCLTFQQCCGFGSALIWLSWIRIRIVNADPNRERGSGSKSRSMGPITSFQKIFHVKFEHFVTLKYDHDPDWFRAKLWLH
jgi:hypothetical protein